MSKVGKKAVQGYAALPERWNEMLKQYEPPALDAAKKEALTDYVARRKSELPDAWY